MAGDSTDLEYNLYFVCLFDLLGQTSKLKNWERHPRNIKELKIAATAIRETVGVIESYRLCLDRRIANSTEQLKSRIEKDFPGPSAKIVDAMIPAVRIQQFSDTFVLVAPAIQTDSENGRNIIAFAQLAHIFDICSIVTLQTLAKRIPLRGAITVGTGVWMRDNWFYGPALAEAHFLESRKAGYPRIVVSKSVIDVMDNGTYVFQAQTDFADKFNMPSYKQYLRRDYDDLWILDFLGPTFALVRNDFSEDARSALSFVDETANDFSSDAKLGPRYERLKNYMHERLQDWEFYRLLDARGGNEVQNG